MATASNDASVGRVNITHPDRRLFDEPPLTKLELARYYEAIGEYLMPHLKGRRLALLRCPDGLHGPCFFQKHIHDDLPRGVALDGDMVIVRDLGGVITLVQRGVIEFHTWGSRMPRSDRPDRLTFDLDPGPDVGWREVARAAGMTRDLLRELGFEPFLKTTGGKGMHLVAPLRAAHDWDTVREFCKAVAHRLEDAAPDLMVANMAKERRKEHVFVDYLRNGDGATAVAAFSARARAGAPVSMPVPWDVLEAQKDPRGAAFSVGNALQHARLWADGKARDPWAGYDSARKSLTVAARRQVGVA
jgi:DNA ligase D